MSCGHGGNLRAAQMRYGIPAGQFVDFSANINPYGPSDGVLQALAENLASVRNYPDPDCVLVREAIAAHLNVSPDWVMAGNGASELIYLLARVLGWKQALVVQPTFSEYAAAVSAAGGRVREVRTLAAAGFAPSLERMAAALPGCDAVFWCQPNNPTGRLLEPEDLNLLAGLAKRAGASLVVDEAFLDFVPARDAYSALNLQPRYPGLLVLYSLTKILAVPGLRLGALIGPPPLLARLAAARDPWSVNTLAQTAGAAGLAERKFLEECAARLESDQEELARLLSALPGVRVFPSRANFLLLDIGGSGYSSRELVDALGRRGVLVRDCANFPGLSAGYVRVAVRTGEDNARLVSTLAGVLGERAGRPGQGQDFGGREAKFSGGEGAGTTPPPERTGSLGG